jgi:hypothetical protein
MLVACWLRAAAPLRAPPSRLSEGPAPASGPLEDGKVPIDYYALEQERQMGIREIDDKQATAAELASHLPAWAAEMMLDPEKSEEYEMAQASARAKYLNDRRVEDRTWDEIDVSGLDGDGAGMAEFTPAELAEDYQLPLETVCAALLSYGLDVARLRVHAPVKSVCTNSQVNELLNFVGSADPIACREELCESTLAELAEQPDVEVTAEQLLKLCHANQISAVLGVETRIRQEDVTLLLDAAESEAAFAAPAFTAQGDDDDDGDGDGDGDE